MTLPSPPGALTLRPVKPEDLESILALMVEANACADGEFAPAFTAGHVSISDWFHVKHLDQSWCITDSNGVVGHVGLRHDLAAATGWGLPGDRSWSEIGRLAVHPRQQQRGLAGILMRHALEHLDGRAPWLTCSQGSVAHRFYLASGWHQTDLTVRWEHARTLGALLTLQPLT